ncbi:MAG: zinc ABC transporter substrate-binding protein [Desulfosalsimonas sp.]|uniref:metal ABC transporter solute-binding protein, Zn/Mn family n=1 Tax=Desulfosalsimonas sp. TaxID=3073848 RepID=UPI0039706717
MKPREKNCLRIFVMAVLSAAALLLAAGPAPAAGLKAFVSIQPQKYFVERIGGQTMEVNVMVAPGSHPAVYEPSPRQMAALSRADLYFAAGVPFEDAWLKKIRPANPDLKIVHTDAWIQKQPIDRNGSTEADHGHNHGNEDPHIWLSPPLVMIQARHIVAALSQADPDNADTYEANGQKFISELAQLDTRLRRMFAQRPQNREFLVFHPSWGYFADAYGLKQIPVEISGKTPRATDLQRLITLAREKGIQTVLIQPQVSSKSAQTIARAIDGNVVSADPLAENWPENLVEVAGKILEAAR